MNQKKVWNTEYSNHTNKWKKARITVPINLKNKVVLEVGVGNGKNLWAILKQKPKKVYAIDISQSALNTCISDSKLILKKESITETSFINNKFDVIICTYVLDNMLYKDRILAINEIYRILKIDGVLFIENFMNGDYRQNSKSLNIIEQNTLIRKNGLIQHFFELKEIENLLGIFSNLMINIKKLNPIRLEKKLQRKIIQITATK